ncbi:hypothetical protein IAQ61_001715 [Plenodomus lingam]|uniref:uncharacterized protein n=1 Tax=Leptosphaeria maculans TaxID=5022 RepID=UPI00332FAA5A|nr:hypothetical protein IAQ61_001715 [Plenodomus lingam]
MHSRTPKERSWWGRGSGAAITDHPCFDKQTATPGNKRSFQNTTLYRIAREEEGEEEERKRLVCIPGQQHWLLAEDLGATLPAEQFPTSTSPPARTLSFPTPATYPLHRWLHSIRRLGVLATRYRKRPKQSFPQLLRGKAPSYRQSDPSG